jgi:hypothetical protein
MKKPIFCAIFALVLCCIAGARASAQDAYLYSGIDYDDATNTVWGYSATEIDYYSAYVEGRLYNQYGALVGSGWDEAEVKTLLMC